MLIAVAPLVAEHRLSGVQTLVLLHVGSVVVALRLRWSAACGIFSDQGSNPCLLHWQAYSLLLSHRESPVPCVFIHSSLQWHMLLFHSTTLSKLCIQFHPILPSRFSSTVFFVKPSLTPQQVLGTCLLYFCCTLYVSGSFFLTMHRDFRSLTYSQCSINIAVYVLFSSFLLP